MATTPAPMPTANAPCQCGCSWFVCWVQTWATPGGNLILLTFLTVFLITVTVYMMHAWGPASPAVMFVVPIAGGFAGAVTTRMGIDMTRNQHTRSTDRPDGNGSQPAPNN